MPREYSMGELLDRLDLDITANGNMQCPFCQHRGRTLHVNFEKNQWICPKCDSSGGTLRFFTKYQLGTDLPIDRVERGKISKQLAEFMGETEDLPAPSRKTSPPKKRYTPVYPASDSHINAVYAAMSNFPELQLSDTHRKELLKRGLSNDAIERNGYRSIPEHLPNAEPYISQYEREGGNERRRLIFENWKFPVKNIYTGLMIAASLVNLGFDLTGVPGFFRFGNSWCFLAIPGILIPTRNMKGEIVVWQIRQKTEPKYMTVHCGSFPGAVTESVSRCHFPLGNSKPGPNTPTIFIEGPLKGDVSLHLFGRDAFFMAIPGVTSVTDLLRYTKILKQEYGVTTIQNGYDMDRLTNMNVKRGSIAITQKLHSQGFTVTPIYWGSSYASYKYTALSMIARRRNVHWKEAPGSNIFERLSCVVDALDAAGIKPCISSNGTKFYWDPATKGMDDYYLSLQR